MKILKKDNVIVRADESLAKQLLLEGYEEVVDEQKQEKTPKK